MEWYIFALLAPAFWAVNNVFIKFLISEKFKTYLPMIFSVVFIDAIFAFVILLLVPISTYFPYFIFALLGGLMPLSAFWFYLKALMTEEVSRIVTLFQLTPVFVVFLSVIFLNEVLVVQKYFGIISIVVAAILISYKKSRGERSFLDVLKFMTPFGVIIATYTILDKYLLEYLDFFSLFFWSVIGTFCGALFLLSFSRLRKEFTETISIIGKRVLFVTFIGEGLYVLGAICSLIAISLVDVSLASALFGLQPFFVFFYTLVLSFFLPEILKEETSKSAIALKFSAIALMLIGTWQVI